MSTTDEEITELQTKFGAQLAAQAMSQGAHCASIAFDQGFSVAIGMITEEARKSTSLADLMQRIESAKTPKAEPEPAKTPKAEE